MVSFFGFWLRQVFACVFFITPHLLLHLCGNESGFINEKVVHT